MRSVTLLQETPIPQHGGIAPPPWGLAAVLASGAALPLRSGADVLRLGDLVVPLRGGRIWPRFPSAPAWPHLPYADVFAGRFDPATVDGARVLLGSSQGADDLHLTPAGRWYGLQIQAAATQSILRGDALRPLGRGIRAVIATLGLGGLLLLLRSRRGRRLGRDRILATGFAAIGGTLLASWALARFGLWWPGTDLAGPVGLLLIVESLRGRRRAIADR